MTIVCATRPSVRAPTTKICAAVRWVVRQGFTLRRTVPRRIAAWRVEQSSARTRRRGTLRHKGISYFGVPKRVPKTATIACGAEPSVNARRRLKPARQFSWPCAKGSHPAVQGNDASRRDGSDNAASAPETWHSPQQGYSKILGAKTCSQNKKKITAP